MYIFTITMIGEILPPSVVALNVLPSSPTELYNHVVKNINYFNNDVEGTKKVLWDDLQQFPLTDDVFKMFLDAERENSFASICGVSDDKRIIYTIQSLTGYVNPLLN